MAADCFAVTERRPVEQELEDGILVVHPSESIEDDRLSKRALWRRRWVRLRSETHEQEEASGNTPWTEHRAATGLV